MVNTIDWLRIGEDDGKTSLSINLLQWIEVMGISTHSDSEQLYVTNHSECDTTGFGSRVVNVADFRRQAWHIWPGLAT